MAFEDIATLFVLPAIPVLLSILVGWVKAPEVGVMRAALPIPALTFLLAISFGVLIATGEGDMSALGFVLIIFGAIVAAVSLLLGWNAAELRLRRDGRR